MKLIPFGDQKLCFLFLIWDPRLRHFGQRICPKCRDLPNLRISSSQLSKNIVYRFKICSLIWANLSSFYLWTTFETPQWRLNLEVNRPPPLYLPLLETTSDYRPKTSKSMAELGRWPSRGSIIDLTHLTNTSPARGKKHRLTFLL